LSFSGEIWGLIDQMLTCSSPLVRLAKQRVDLLLGDDCDRPFSCKFLPTKSSTKDIDSLPQMRYFEVLTLLYGLAFCVSTRKFSQARPEAATNNFEPLTQSNWNEQLVG
jgi:hypothetical protein